MIARNIFVSLPEPKRHLMKVFNERLLPSEWLATGHVSKEMRIYKGFLFFFVHAPLFWSIASFSLKCRRSYNLIVKYPPRLIRHSTR